VSLRDLPNIGVTLAQRLSAIGIHSKATLLAVGPAEAYRRLYSHQGQKLPVCYYLYSLHGALTGRDWRELTEGLSVLSGWVNRVMFWSSLCWVVDLWLFRW